MPEEKIRCQFCGRKNHINNDLCESCGATLPDVPLVLRVRDDVDVDQFKMSYLNLMVTFSGFTYRDGQLMGVR